MYFYNREVLRLKQLYRSNDAQLETVISTKNYIDTNFDSEINLVLLAYLRHTSKFHLLRLFKKYYGITPHQYVIEKRITKAQELLTTGTNVTEACYSVGFNSLSSFIYQFKKKTGVLPSQYLKKSNF